MKFKNIGALFFTGIAAASLHTAKSEALLAGVKTSGMAATSVSNPIDAFSGAYNPASITNVRNRVDIGVSWVQTHQAARVRDLPTYFPVGDPCDSAGSQACNPNQTPNTVLYLCAGAKNPCQYNGYYEGAKTADNYIPEFGINARWDLTNACTSFVNKCFNTCYEYPFEIATSLVVYNRSDLKTTYGKPFPLFGTTKLGLEYVHETGSFIIATRILKMHSFGLALNYNVQRLKINGLENFSHPLFSEAPLDTTNRGYNYSNGFGVVLGYFFEWNPFKIGISWQPHTSMKKFHKYRGFVADSGNFNLPERFSSGISYTFMDNITAAFDYEFIRWTDIPQLKNPTFPNLNNPQILLGNKNGAGFGFRNQSFYRFGVEFRPNDCLSLRAGFRHANSPVKAKSTAVNLLTLDAMENVLTFGASWKFNCKHEISIFYAAGMCKNLRGKNSIPLTIPQLNAAKTARLNYIINADPDCSTTELPGCSTENLVKGDGEVDIKQRRAALGISYGWNF